MMTSRHAVRGCNRGRTHAVIVRRRHRHGSRQRGEGAGKQGQQHQFGSQAMHIWIEKGHSQPGGFPTIAQQTPPNPTIRAGAAKSIGYFGPPHNPR